MKAKLQTIAIYFLILNFFISGCGPANPAPVTPAGASPLPTATPAAPLAATPTAAPSPTVAPTPTVYPPVFDPETIGDNRVLDSFILTRKEKTTGCGGSDEIDRTYTIGYIKEPFNAYMVHKFSITTDEFFEHKTYLIGGRFYTTNGSVDWLILLEAPSDEIDILQRAADMRDGYINQAGVLSAQFLGQEDLQGIPANHFSFTLDQTNLRERSDPTGTYKIEAAQGDLYLAQDGNYLLYFRAKLTGILCSRGGSPGYFPGVREFTEELTSINQLTEFAVPAEYLEPEQTLLELDLPLPAGTTLVAMRRFGSSRWDTYGYAASVSND